MGVTVTAFTNGTTMVSADVTANFNAIVSWLNGGIVTSDINVGTLPTRVFRSIESRIDTPANSRGPTGKTTRFTVDTAPQKRTYATADSHGDSYEEVATMGTMFYAEDAGNIEVVFEWWTWAIQSDQTNPEVIRQGDWRVSLNGVGIDATIRSLHDSGHDSNTGSGAGFSDGGQFVYPARNFQALFQRPVSAGWNKIALHINCVAYNTARAQQALVIVGARNRHLEYWRR